MVLPVAACGILAATAEQVLTTAWNDVAQFLMWLAMGVDGVIARRRFLLAVVAVFLSSSAFEIATHL